jgi:ribosomal subunit interface protein
MQLLISGKQVDVGDSLRGHVRARIEGSVAKYFGRPIDGNVTFSKVAHLYRTDCSVHAGSGIRVQVQAEDPDIYASFEAAMERLDKRLHRWKGRLKEHHNASKANGGPAIAARSYLIAHEDDEAEPPAPADGKADLPVIVAESTTDILTLTVREAVMRLDLGELPALMFRNGAHGGLNVVYRRPDGHIGWIDPGPKAGSETR